MGFTIARKPELDLHGQRWVEFAPGAKILVGSAADPVYRSHRALVNRHLAAVDSQAGVGTKQFSVAQIPQVEIEVDDELYMDLVAHHLIKDWQGVDVAERPGEPAQYTPELGKALIEQMPSVYFLALRTGVDIANRVEERIKESVGKLSPSTDGAATGRAKRTRKSAGNVSA